MSFWNRDIVGLKHISVLIILILLATTANAAAVKNRPGRTPHKRTLQKKSVRKKTAGMKAQKKSLRKVSHRRSRRSARGRRLQRVVWNPMFRGSREMQIRQNLELDMLNLPRIADDEELELLEAQQELVPVEDSESLAIASNLQPNRRYCRPWTRDFLVELGEAFYREFGKPIMVTSLVRTVDQQKKLRRRNGNAAPQEGETASTHLTGVTVDILKRGLTRKQHNWLNQYLLPLKDAGEVEPIEERRQPVFHIVVYNTYGQPDKIEEIPAPDPLTVLSTN